MRAAILLLAFVPAAVSASPMPDPAKAKAGCINTGPTEANAAIPKSGGVKRLDQLPPANHQLTSTDARSR